MFQSPLASGRQPPKRVPGIAETIRKAISMTIEVQRWLAAKAIRLAIRLTPLMDNGTRLVLGQALNLTTAKDE